jgi:hypothetical protein
VKIPFLKKEGQASVKIRASFGADNPMSEQRIGNAYITQFMVPSSSIDNLKQAQGRASSTSTLRMKLSGMFVLMGIKN